MNLLCGILLFLYYMMSFTLNKKTFLLEMSVFVCDRIRIDRDLSGMIKDYNCNSYLLCFIFIEWLIY